MDTRAELVRSTLGRYRIIDELGSGGMARVYLGLSTGLGGFTKLAVLKVMRRELARDPEAVKLFLGEARLAARFNHPNVVQTTEVGEDAGCYFINMEYLEGLPLGVLLGKTISAPLPLAARLEIACQLLDGLVYLHELSNLDGSPLCLVHRDISPSNVFVTYEGTVKLLDFGVAKATGVSEVSEVGSFKGKVGYAAPEQLRGYSDARSDVFTAGLLLWEMLSYRRLWMDRTHADILRGRVSGADADLMRSKQPGIPEPLLQICVQAAALEPDDRYQTASALRDAVRGYTIEHSLQFSAEQLRLLLAGRFDDLRKATRRRIDQRLKEVQLDAPTLSGGTGARSHSQTPHAFVDSSQRLSVRGLQTATQRRRLLGVAGGVTLALAASLSGAYLAQRAHHGSGFTVARPSGTASAPSSPSPPTREAPSRAAAAGVAFVPPKERGTRPVTPELDGTRDDASSEAASGSRKHRADSRAPARPHPVTRTATESFALGAATPPRKSAENPPKGGASEPSDFVHGRSANKPSRSIDTASPYSPQSP